MCPNLTIPDATNIPVPVGVSNGYLLPAEQEVFNANITKNWFNEAMVHR